MEGLTSKKVSTKGICKCQSHDTFSANSYIWWALFRYLSSSPSTCPLINPLWCGRISPSVSVSRSVAGMRRHFAKRNGAGSPQILPQESPFQIWSASYVSYPFSIPSQKSACQVSIVAPETVVNNLPLEDFTPRYGNMKNHVNHRRIPLNLGAVRGSRPLVTAHLHGEEI